MDRGRDRRFENDRAYGSDYHRPPHRSGPPSGAPYRDYRSPPRRPHSPSSFTERYAPRSPRRRSRSPGYQARNDIRYQRPRSPPRRAYSPRGRDRSRSSRPRVRRSSRSPRNSRFSPPYRKEVSPANRKQRSPSSRPRRPPSPRYANPRHQYSPTRDTWARQSYDEARALRDRGRSTTSSRHEYFSRPASPAASRRSPSSFHPNGPAQSGSKSRSSVGHKLFDAKRETIQRNASSRESPPPQNVDKPTQKQSSAVQGASSRSPPRFSQDAIGSSTSASIQARQATVAPSLDPSHVEEAEPRSLTMNHESSADTREPPSGPSSLRSGPPPTQHQPGTTSILTAPTRPRGATSLAKESRDYAHGPSYLHRGGRAGTLSSFRPSSSTHESQPSGAAKVAGGSRSGLTSLTSTSSENARQAPFRGSNSSSTTYPRTQRFTNHLATLSSVLPGGRAMPPVDPAAAKKLSQLDDDADRLRRQIDEKQKIKRASLREWETRERESRREGLRSELAESHLASLSSEVVTGQAF